MSEAERVLSDEQLAELERRLMQLANSECEVG
jgi:hypothetical protein